MAEMKHVTVRVEDDIYWFLKKNTKHRKEKNFSDYMRSLIFKGLISDMEESYLKAESVYQNALHEARSYEITAKNKEIEQYQKRIDRIKRELDLQQKLLINICYLSGLTDDQIMDASSDVDEAKGFHTNLRFHNKLLVEIAKKKGKSAEIIKGWLSQ